MKTLPIVFAVGSILAHASAASAQVATPIATATAVAGLPLPLPTATPAPSPTAAVAPTATTTPTAPPRSTTTLSDATRTTVPPSTSCSADWAYKNQQPISAVCYVVNAPAVTSAETLISDGGLHQNIVCIVTYPGSPPTELALTFGYGGLGSDYSGTDLGGKVISSTNVILPANIPSTLAKLCELQTAVDTSIATGQVKYCVSGGSTCGRFVANFGNICNGNWSKVGVPSFNCRTVADWMFPQLPIGGVPSPTAPASCYWTPGAGGYGGSVAACGDGGSIPSIEQFTQDFNRIPWPASGCVWTSADAGGGRQYVVFPDGALATTSTSTQCWAVCRRNGCTMPAAAPQ